MGVGSGGGGGICSFFFPSVQILCCPGVQTLPGIQSFSGALQNSQYLQVWHSVIAARGLTANWSSGGEKNHIVYSLLCIFITIMIRVLIFPLLPY